MNLTTIATTTLFIGLGLTQALSAETIENAKQTVANAKPIKVDLPNSSLNSANSKQLYIQIGSPLYYYDPEYWSWSLLLFGDYYYNSYNPYYSGYGYYGDRYYNYGDRYYGQWYHPRYNYYYSVNQIRDIYHEVLGREPDYTGLRTWLGDRRDGNSLGDIRRSIAQSDEAATRINQIYQEVLGRNADREGLRTWTNRLASGASLSEVRRDIENSPEAVSLRNNRRYPAYNPSVNYSQPRRYTPPTTVYPSIRTIPSRDYSRPVQTFPNNNAPVQRYPNWNFPSNAPIQRYPNRNFPSNNAPTLRYPNRNFPPATFSPAQRTPSGRYSPADNYQQPTRRYSPSRSHVPRTDSSSPNRRDSNSTVSPSIPTTPSQTLK